MKNKAFYFISILLLLVSCKKEKSLKDLSPDWDIVIKQKDSTGIYQELVRMNLFPDSIFYDSIQYSSSLPPFFSSTKIPDYSLFASDKIIITGYPHGDSITVSAIELDSEGRYLHFYPEFYYPYKEPITSEPTTDFYYHLDGKISAIGYGTLYGTGGCGAGGSYASMNYLTAFNGNDSLLIDIGTLSCSAPNDVYRDTIYVSYLDKYNNTRALALTYPLFIYSNPYTFSLTGFDLLPFKTLDAKLVDHAQGSIIWNNMRFAYTADYKYTFDIQGRVKTAVIDQFITSLPQQMRVEWKIEFNYRN